jgi:hypothetical protein
MTRDACRWPPGHSADVATPAVFQSSKGCQSAKVEILFAERTVLLALVIRSAPGPETYSRWWRIQVLERAAPVALNGIKPVVVIVFISVLPGWKFYAGDGALAVPLFASLWHPAWAFAGTVQMCQSHRFSRWPLR